jgi:hypothetical protein
MTGLFLQHAHIQVSALTDKSLQWAASIAAVVRSIMVILTSLACFFSCYIDTAFFMACSRSHSTSPCGVVNDGKCSFFNLLYVMEGGKKETCHCKVGLSIYHLYAGQFPRSSWDQQHKSIHHSCLQGGCCYLVPPHVLNIFLPARMGWWYKNGINSSNKITSTSRNAPWAGCFCSMRCAAISHDMSFC